VLYCICSVAQVGVEHQDRGVHGCLSSCFDDASNPAGQYTTGALGVNLPAGLPDGAAAWLRGAAPSSGARSALLVSSPQSTQRQVLAALIVAH